MTPAILFILNKTDKKWRKTENDKDRREIWGIRVKYRQKERE